jgi:hypothetical protein
MRVKIRSRVIERRAFERGWFDRNGSRNGKSKRDVGASLGEGKGPLREANEAVTELRWRLVSI